MTTEPKAISYSLTALVLFSHAAHSHPVTLTRVKCWLNIVGSLIGLTFLFAMASETPRLGTSNPDWNSNILLDTIPLTQTIYYLPVVIRQTASQGATLRDLLDWEHEKNLTLDDLEWQPEYERTIDGVRVIVGSWSGGQFSTFDSNGEPKTITLREKAAIYLPPGYPDRSLLGYGKGFIDAQHVAQQLAVRVENPAWEIPVAKYFGVVVLVHGEEASDWESLGASDRDHLFRLTLQYMLQQNRCNPSDYITGNFALALMRTNVRAISLAARITESLGGEATEFALMGGSKEGYATWLASAVDDRIAVAMPSGFELLDIEGWSQYEKNNGCEGKGAAAAKIVDLLYFRNWMRDSPAGQQFAKLMLVSDFKYLLHPKFVLMDGDVGMRSMHDGAYFTLGAETHFLENFSETEWRYLRWPGGDRVNHQPMLTALRLVFGDDVDFPKVTQARLEDDNTNLVVHAQVSGSPVAVRLWWNHSPNRAFNDLGQAPWQTITMTFSGVDYISPAFAAPVGEQVAWYVEAETPYAIYGVTIPMRDASPVRFARELPPLTCDSVPKIECPTALNFRQHLPLVIRNSR